MTRKKKEIIENIEESQELDLTTGNSEDEDNGRKAEILVGDKFKILVTSRNYEVVELRKTKKKNPDGTETIVEEFKNHYAYYGTLLGICKYLKDYIVRQKIFDKKTISNLAEAIQVIKDSYKETEKLFGGINI